MRQRLTFVRGAQNVVISYASTSDPHLSVPIAALMLLGGRGLPLYLFDTPLMLVAPLAIQTQRLRSFCSAAVGLWDHPLPLAFRCGPPAPN